MMRRVRFVGDGTATFAGVQYGPGERADLSAYEAHLVVSRGLAVYVSTTGPATEGTAVRASHRDPTVIGGQR